MPAKRRQSWLDKNWPFRHTEVKCNTDTNAIKIIAMVTMLIDHMGAALFPQYRIMRIIGRVAYPIYAYCIAVGCVYTRDMGKYLQRIVFLALICQPIYVLALNHTNSLMYMVSFAESPLRAAFNFYVYSWKHPGILMSMAIGAANIWALKERKVWVVLLSLTLCYLLTDKIDYGVKGQILMLLMYMFIDKWYVSLPAVGAFLVYWGLQGSSYSLFGVSFGIQMFALMALPFMYIPMRTGLKINKWVFYAFYPAHLLLILLCKHWGDITALIFK